MTVSSTSVVSATATTPINPLSIGSRRTLIITLSTVCSVVSVLLCIGIGFVCWRCRRQGLFPRGITPINDDEIETWKAERVPEKATEIACACASKDEGNGVIETSFPIVTSESWDVSEISELNSDSVTASAGQSARGFNIRNVAAIKQPKRAPSKVIIDQESLPPSQLTNGNSGPRGSSAYPYILDAPATISVGAAAVSSSHHHKSDEMTSPRGVRSARSLSLGQNPRIPIIGRLSLDQNRGREGFALSQLSPHGEQFYESRFPADVRARAPNSRIGLTDEMIPGDPSFLPSPRTVRRQPSRLTKQRPVSGGHRKSTSTSSDNVGGGHGFWGAHTRNGRSNSSVSGRSLVLGGLRQQDQNEEQIPPLPSALISASLAPQNCQIPHQRSLSDLAHASDAGYNNSRSHAYLNRHHGRFNSSSAVQLH